ncbi:hypothetical protein [Tsukamurella soli]|uniref:Uncharacterized protein n=1 Tax=Tsukamurella soli TaxID=644556 RepID=A0ABP8J6P2_9ACTN
MPDHAVRDYDAFFAHTANIRAKAQALRNEAQKRRAAVLEALHRETTCFTRDGSVAPIYQGTVDAMTAVWDRVGIDMETASASAESFADQLDAWAKANRGIDQHTAATMLGSGEPGSQQERLDADPNGDNRVEVTSTRRVGKH